MTEKVKTRFIDHICIAVNDVKKAEEDYKNMFGWEVAYRYVFEPEKIRVTGFKIGDVPTTIEVMEDTDGTGNVAQFIKRSGEGVMLMSFNVESCEEATATLKKNGVAILPPGVRSGDLSKEAGGIARYAFIHPKGCHGIMLEVIDHELPI